MKGEAGQVKKRGNNIIPGVNADIFNMFNPRHLEIGK